ncbi:MULTISPECIES: sensor histidine kinase [Desulfovibrio]|uniref:histidine kinase n=1 Tax=Desulfovibrio desulfuricans TaxID=876 RepID=A0AA94HQK9_DESDE|nr:MULTISPECIES: sensor histidine kinase [Desulfovibrio]ATD81702.1 two-component sensor histidine kinase [Desulfovibrio sp. G11]SFW17415.1 two-component system, NtrC family, sensor kinase [Desulfovibrio desulfuricans]SPD34426.1 histidine kinase, two-component system [Desulfovibrio sp. G11]
MFAAIKNAFAHLLEVPEAVSPARYRSLRRLMTILMVAVSVTPLLLLSGISHMQYTRTLEREMESPVYALARKSQAALELYLGERESTVSFIAHAYSYKDLADERTLNRVFLSLRSEFQGFVDMGLVNSEGLQISYVGPYKLRGADYVGKPWLRETEIKSRYMSNVFLGYRGYPHMVIAVHRMEESGLSWTLRVAVDTLRLQQVLSSVGPEQETDVFLVDREGVLQTDSRLYGKALDSCPLPLPPATAETLVRNVTEPSGRKLMVASCALAGTDFILLAVKPEAEAFRPWTALRTELLLVLCGGIALIVLVSHLLMKQLVNRLQASDERRVAIFAQMEHNQKLSSIGRLAAGVAHEVNNPLAVIYEKAGLARDLLSMGKVCGESRDRERLNGLLEGIESTVERARSITHRLLGFARRMEANRQSLHIEEVITETLSFLEREAKNRGVTLEMDLAEDLPEIVSDRGQLQQVFLNIVGNALDAVTGSGQAGASADGQGRFVKIRCVPSGQCALEVTVRDNGKGMPREVLRHIFEPFYSTKKDKGTGLGMFITYGIVRRLGGDIRVDSEEGRGSTVRVTLPLAPPDGSVEV